MNGSVKWFNTKKGYGFITGEDGTEYFVHYTGITSAKKFKVLKEGFHVTFDINVIKDEKSGESKTYAVNVKVVKSE